MAGSGRTLRDNVRPATRATPLRPRPAPQVRASTQTMEPCAGGGGAADSPAHFRACPTPPRMLEPVLSPTGLSSNRQIAGVGVTARLLKKGKAWVFKAHGWGVPQRPPRVGACAPTGPNAQAGASLPFAGGESEAGGPRMGGDKGSGWPGPSALLQAREATSPCCYRSLFPSRKKRLFCSSKCSGEPSTPGAARVPEAPGRGGDSRAGGAVGPAALELCAPWGCQPWTPGVLDNRVAGSGSHTSHPLSSIL